MNLLVSIFAAVGVAGWVYSKVNRSSGGNLQSSAIVAGFAGLAAFVVMMMIMKALPA